MRRIVRNTYSRLIRDLNLEMWISYLLFVDYASRGLYKTRLLYFSGGCCDNDLVKKNEYQNELQVGARGCDMRTANNIINNKRCT